MDTVDFYVKSPVFSLGTADAHTCLVSAGGGASKTGVKNMLVGARAPPKLL